MIRVFISYSHRDREFVKSLEQALKRGKGVELYDPAAWEPGSETASMIRAQIESSDVVLACVGPDRPNVLLETGMALGAGKDVLLAADAVNSLPLSLQSLPVVVLSGDETADCRAVVRRLLAMQPGKRERPAHYSSAVDKLRAYRSDPHFFESISPRAFEQLVAEVFESQGFEVALTGKTADAGFDVVLRNPADQKLVAVEVKKYSKQGRVPIGTIRELLGAAILQNCDTAIVVTSASFTSGAAAMAAQSTKPRLILMTMDSLLDTPDMKRLLANKAINIKQEDRERIEKYLMLDEEQLYTLIPEHTAEYRHVQFHPDGQKSAGRRIFDRMKDDLNRLICVEWQYCKKQHEPDLTDPVALVAALGDVIVSACGGIPQFIIAAILVKKGLIAFCECDRASGTEHSESQHT